MTLSPDLRNLLVCPFCRGELRDEPESLVCSTPLCGLRYPIREGIPIMDIGLAERPCPGCGKNRDWKENRLSCPSCGETFCSPVH